MTEPIQLAVDGRLARVTLSRPDSRNAFDMAMLTAFEDVLTDLGRQRGIEVAVLSGMGKAFCAGTDLKELERLTDADTLHWQRRTGELVERWTRLEATTVTAFNGPAVGSGAIVGLASDLRIAVEGTFFRFPEAAYGIPLTWSGIPILNALLGADRTRRALLLAERLETDELRRLDLIMKAVAPDELGRETDALVARLLDSPQMGRLMAKRAVAAAAAAPGFATGAFEPFLATLGVMTRPGGGFGNGGTG
jgi:enoyl-CoA hydratase/carnithine racemase